MAIMTLKNELVALGYAEMTSDEIMRAQRGIAVKTTRVVMKKGTYPPMWKRRNTGGGKAEEKPQGSEGKSQQ